MKALVIGGTGPTGPYIIDGLFKRGYEVSIFHSGAHEIELSPEVEHIHASPHFLETIQEALGNRQFDLAIATYGRLKFIAQSLKGHVARFISVGGGGVYQAWSSHAAPEDVPIPIPEDAPLMSSQDGSFQYQEDTFHYRMVEAESEVIEAHQGGYYSATHFRYPMIYGPRQLAPVEWSILRRILDGRTQLILSEAGLTIRSRGYAENMAHALLLAVDKPDVSRGQIYNVRDERLLSVRAWVTIICKLMNHKFEFVEMPYSIARPAHIYSWGFYHRLTDITKVREQLGYTDIIPVDKALELTIKWYLENRPSPGGETERQLRDAFDYALEDKIITEFKTGWQRVRQLLPPPQGYRHPYAHPKNHPQATR